MTDIKKQIQTASKTLDDVKKHKDDIQGIISQSKAADDRIAHAKKVAELEEHNRQNDALRDEKKQIQVCS